MSAFRAARAGTQVARLKFALKEVEGQLAAARAGAAGAAGGADAAAAALREAKRAAQRCGGCGGHDGWRELQVLVPLGPWGCAAVQGSETACLPGLGSSSLAPRRTN